MWFFCEKKIDNFLNDFTKDFLDDDFFTFRSKSNMNNYVIEDLKDDKDNLSGKVFRFKLPGFVKEELKVTINNDNRLIVKAQKKLDDDYFIPNKTIEVTLDDRFDKNKVESFFKEGILYVKIYFKDEEKEEVINISVL